jgi:predicted nucleic acid-binding protein
LIEKFGYEKNRVDQLIDLIRQKAIFVRPAFSLKLCQDEHDDKFIDCAILGRAKYLVSEDKDILDDIALKKQLYDNGIKTCSALEFCQVLKKMVIEK